MSSKLNTKGSDKTLKNQAFLSWQKGHRLTKCTLLPQLLKAVITTTTVKWPHQRFYKTLFFSWQPSDLQDEAWYQKVTMNKRDVVSHLCVSKETSQLWTHTAIFKMLISIKIDLWACNFSLWNDTRNTIEPSILHLHRRTRIKMWNFTVCWEGERISRAAVQLVVTLEALFEAC